jgi:protein KIBRA
MWLNQVVIRVNERSGLQVEARLGEKSPEERRMERLLRRTAREIYKLRKTRTNKGQLDVQSFRLGLYYLLMYNGFNNLVQRKSDRKMEFLTFNTVCKSFF